MKSARIDWVDTAKGLGIILVVVGHAERGIVAGRTAPLTPSIQFLDTWIYSFHMPLFFFLAGLFLYHSAEKTNFHNFALGKLRTVAYPYFVWSIIVVLLKLCLGDLPNQPASPSDLLMIPIEPKEQFWFLYVLFILSLLFGALFSFGGKPWTAVAIAVIAHPSINPYIPYLNSSLAEAREFAIFVALGSLAGQSCRFKAGIKTPLISAPTAVAGLLAPALAIWGDVDQRMGVVVALSGTTGAIACSMLIRRFDNPLSRFTNFIGRHTLEIYVAHITFSAATRIFLAHISIQNFSIHLFFGAAAGLAGPLLLATILVRAGFRFAFTFPSHPIRPGLDRAPSSPLTDHSNPS